jgi:uncharacterized protein (DUF305 family)
MTSTKSVIAAMATASAVLTLSACSTSTTEKSAPPTASASTSESAPAQAQAHNSADVMFAQHMIPHHQQAIEMSDIILGKQGIDPRVTELATTIKAAQGPEIETMTGWLSQWGEPTTMPGMDMPGHSMPSDSMMPGMSGMGMGMMSPADMDALKNAQGVDASKLFLTGMIAHHQGAIDMANSEIKDGQFAPAIEMAKSIVTSQQQEIDQMKAIVASL